MSTDIRQIKFENILCQFITQEFTEEKMDVSLTELGLNSYNAIELMIAIEVEYDIEFPDDLITPDLFLSPRTLYKGLLRAQNVKKREYDC